MHSSLARIVTDLRREPSRTGSLIITIFGDAIAPRGGSVWLGTLLELLALLGVEGGVVRTAMSRLAADGWLERRKVGRNSFYRLADNGRRTFEAAVRHVYDPTPSGTLTLLLLPRADATDAGRKLMRQAGYGSPLPGVFIAPADASLEPDAGTIRLALADNEETRKLVAVSWPLAEMAGAYHRFIATFEPLRRALQEDLALSPADAMVARVLLVHAFRRVMLRDPLLPATLLPEAWPGADARALCSAVYRALLPTSERWLDAHASNETGPLPPPGPSLGTRFSS